MKRYYLKALYLNWVFIYTQRLENTYHTATALAIVLPENIAKKKIGYLLHSMMRRSLSASLRNDIAEIKATLVRMREAGEWI